MMLRCLMIGALMVAHTALADCCGDCDASGDVRVNELVTSVNNALGGCAAAPVAKVMKPRFVQVDGNFTRCTGSDCTIVSHEGAGMLMWMVASAIDRDQSIVVTLDDDVPQEIQFARDELRKLPSSSTFSAAVVEVPFGGIPFRERLTVQIPTNTFRPTMTLYYLAE